MCWSTPLVHKCSLPSCPTPSEAFKQSTAISPCYHRENLGKHIPWPHGGCSVCKSGNTNPHVTPCEHEIVSENALVVRRSICPTCQKNEGIPELQISKGKEPAYQEELLQPHDFAKTFCGILKIPNPRTSDLAGAIADALESARVQTGISPHPFTAACIYAASHISPCPKPLEIDWLLSSFNLKTRPWFLHAYTTLYTHRDLIATSGVVQHRGILTALPKPCCHRSQTRNCPRQKTNWGFDEDKCTGKQDGGVHVMGAFVGFRNFLHNEGVPVNVPSENYYRESDLELLRKEKLEVQRENPHYVTPMGNARKW